MTSITLVLDITTKQTMNNSGVGMSEWSHLANAKHIDRIIGHVKAHPTAWEESAYNAAWDAANDDDWAAIKAAWEAACDAVKDKSCDSARNAVWNAVWDAVWNSPMDADMDAAMDAMDGAALALVAWDHAGGLMDLPAEQVLVLALLGYQAAILMYAAIAAMETTQELV